MIDQSIQFSNSLTLTDSQTQTTDHVVLTSSAPPTLDELNRISEDLEVTEQKKVKTTLKKLNPRLKKRKTVISKSTIKRASETSEMPLDMVFSPGDKKTSAKIYENTIKKSNTMTATSIQTNPTASGNTSANRFLFRGNEEFHNTAGRGESLRPQLNGTTRSYLTGSKLLSKNKTNGK